MLANLLIGLACWTLGSSVLGLIAAQALTFHVRDDRPHAVRTNRSVDERW